LQAAAEARQKFFEIAAPLLETGAEELRSKNGNIYIASDPSKLMPFREACHKIDPDNPIRGSGSRASNPNAPMFSTFGAQAVELEVDIETGLVRFMGALDSELAMPSQKKASMIPGRANC
jgi:CO/xanthine dehydrogenase Mo-binding subunit